MGELQRTSVRRSATPSKASSREQPARARPEREPAARPLQRMMAVRALQPQLAIGAVDDPFEREAERTADAVTSSGRSAPGAFGVRPLAASLLRVVQRALGKGETPAKKDDDEKTRKVQKKPATNVAPVTSPASAEPEVVPRGIEAQIQTLSTGGVPLAPSVRSTFEPRFGYDFGSVRTHTGSGAAGAAVALGARAFTVGDHIFFGAGEYQPASAAGQRLLAHELTHTIQQQPEAARAARLLPAPQRVQRSILSDARDAALDKLSEWASELPPYELLTVLLGRNPITDKPVERSARNWIHAALQLVPSGMEIFADLEKNKTIEKTAEWFHAEVAKLNLTWSGIKALFSRVWDEIGLTDFLHPTRIWEKVKAIFAPTLQRIANFAAAVGSKIVEFIRTGVLGLFTAWASKLPGYTLLTFILRRDPLTGVTVERTAKTFVKAVLEFVPGGGKMFANLEKSQTIEKTVAWLQGEITKLDLSWEKIKGLFSRAWDAISIPALLHPLDLLDKIAAIFNPPVLRLIAFVSAVGSKILEFIFEGIMLITGPIGARIVGIVRKLGTAFGKILDDPIGFVRNLVKAVKLGFQQFDKNILIHLETGVIDWLVGTLAGAGLVLPKEWDVKGILSLVLQVLDITYAKMRLKLVKLVGEERVVALEKGFAFVQALVTEGPIAAWQRIVDALGSLKEKVLGGIKDWVVTSIVKAAITQLVLLFNPAGAIIEAIVAIYETVAFFIERIKQISALFEAVVESLAKIVAGKVADAANAVELAMARTIPVFLGFLARFLHLGNVSDAVKNVITALREKVDKAIDGVVAWVVEKVGTPSGKANKEDKTEDERWKTAVAGVKGEIATLKAQGFEDKRVEDAIPDWKAKYGFTSLRLDVKGEHWAVKGAMSPERTVDEGDEPGTEKNPFKMVWPKPPTANYPVLYFGGRKELVHHMTRELYFHNPAKNDTGAPMKEYRPEGGINQVLSEGETIGLSPDNYISQGKVIGPLSTKGTPGGEKLSRIIRKYGYSATDDRMQSDHAWEIQFGGKDEKENLWPLWQSINSSAGAKLAGMSVTDPSGAKRKIADLKKDNGKKYYFQIDGFSS